jgi:hypothetical protein
MVWGSARGEEWTILCAFLLLFAFCRILEYRKDHHHMPHTRKVVAFDSNLAYLAAQSD